MSKLDLTPAEYLSLTKMSMPKDVRSKVSPGEHDVDFLVHVQGKIKVGENFESSTPASIPWQKLFIIMASKQNDRTLTATVRDCLAAIKDGTIDDEVVKTATAQVQEIVTELLGSTVKTFDGKVTGAVTATAVTIDQTAELKTVAAAR